MLELWLLEFLHKFRQIRKKITILLYSLLEFFISKSNAPHTEEQISGPLLLVKLFDMMEEFPLSRDQPMRFCTYFL